MGFGGSGFGDSPFGGEEPPPSPPAPVVVLHVANLMLYSKVSYAPAYARVGQTLSLPVRLLQNGLPAVGVVATALSGMGVRLNFSNGETATAVMADDVSWFEVAKTQPVVSTADIVLNNGGAGTFNIQLQPSIGSSGLYIAIIDGSFFTKARRGPFSYGVFPA